MTIYSNSSPKKRFYKVAIGPAFPAATVANITVEEAAAWVVSGGHTAGLTNFAYVGELTEDSRPKTSKGAEIDLLNGKKAVVSENVESMLKSVNLDVANFTKLRALAKNGDVDIFFIDQLALSGGAAIDKALKDISINVQYDGTGEVEMITIEASRSVGDIDDGAFVMTERTVD